MITSVAISIIVLGICVWQCSPYGYETPYIGKMPPKKKKKPAKVPKYKITQNFKTSFGEIPSTKVSRYKIECELAESIHNLNSLSGRYIDMRMNK